MFTPSIRELAGFLTIIVGGAAALLFVLSIFAPSEDALRNRCVMMKELTPGCELLLKERKP